MKTCAVLNDQSVVVNIILCNDNEPETDRLVAYTRLSPAYMGGYYVNGWFYPPQPFPSWTRGEGEWLPPVPYPTDGQMYSWDEASGQWIATD
jgi:hypothetical protein